MLKNRLFLFTFLCLIFSLSIFLIFRTTEPNIRKLSKEEQHERKMAQRIDILRILVWYAHLGESLVHQKNDGSYEYTPNLISKAVAKSRYTEYFSRYDELENIIYSYEGKLITMEQLGKEDVIFSTVVLNEIDKIARHEDYHLLGRRLRDIAQKFHLSSKVLKLYRRAYHGKYDTLPSMNSLFNMIARENPAHNFPNNRKRILVQAEPLQKNRVEIKPKNKVMGENNNKQQLIIPLTNTEAYDHLQDNSFVEVAQDPRSTFSIDVDTASYSNVRRFIQGGYWPIKDAVRIEEMINYFSYNYEEPKDEHPFAVHTTITSAPWNSENQLLQIAIQGKKISSAERPNSNLVFLVDVSGSMDYSNKLPLLKKSIKLLVKQLGENDRIAIVVYAGAAGLVLPSTTCHNQEKILSALDSLRSGGSTNGGEGIRLAYKVAQHNFIKNGINRIVLATDGDFNVGMSDTSSLVRLVEEKAKVSKVFLTVLGFGMGNYNDDMLEKISNKGNGNYTYIDTFQEARKALSEQLNSTLLAIAKDVKIQVEFNPTKVQSFRLIGYANRVMAHQDFDNDKKDAGEIGAGHSVTAFYELVMKKEGSSHLDKTKLKYQKPRELSSAANSDEVLFLKLRYKKINEEVSQLISKSVVNEPVKLKDASSNFVFASSVAILGMILRDSPYKGDSSIDLALHLARKSTDRNRYREEFVELLEKVKKLRK